MLSTLLRPGLSDCVAALVHGRPPHPQPVVFECLDETNAPINEASVYKLVLFTVSAA